MSNPNPEFERFLEEEINRQFKQLPIDHQPIEQKNHVGTPIDQDHSSARTISRKGSGHDAIGFDIQNPPTSFQDPLLRNGKTIAAISGSGRQPGIHNPLIKEPEHEHGILSEVEDISFQSPFDHHISELREVLQQFTNFSHTQQIPFQSDGAAYDYLQSAPGFGSLDKRTGQSGKLTGSAVPGLSKPLDVHRIRQDFPILNEHVNGHRLVWLDNAATTQKPQVVIDRIAQFYKYENSNIHRAAHELAARATDAYEQARNIVKEFLNATSSNEIIFTRGTTESINLVANSWADQHLGATDEIIISHLEHHANIVPWQQLAGKKGFKIRIIPVDDQGNLILEEYAKLLNSNTKLVSFTHVSNALGTITPVKKIIELAHAVGAKVLLDGAQSVSHIRVDLKELNPDFFVFSGHKIFGPTGIGVLYGKEDLLNATQPYQSGGNMIRDVTFERTEFHNVPNRFEAGTGNIADAVGLGAAIRYVQGIGIDAIFDYEHNLLEYATGLLSQIPGIKLIGTAKEKTSVLSFTLDGYTNTQVGQVLNKQGIAVRTGHHCAQPILRRFGYETSVRPSLAFYNTHQEVDLLAKTLDKLVHQGKQYY